MKTEFYCIDTNGVKKDSLLFPKLQPFWYEDGDEGWYLLEDFTVFYNDYKITVRKDFDFDGASIHKALWSVIGHPVRHDVIVAALFHDIFYCVHLQTFLRPEADKFFETVCGIYGASWSKQIAVYSAVRTFGGKHWNKPIEEIERYRKLIEVVKV